MELYCSSYDAARIPLSSSAKDTFFKDGSPPLFPSPFPPSFLPPNHYYTL